MYNIFISHSWSYSDQYNRLIALLEDAPYFKYKDYSVPKEDPIHNAPNRHLLREAIRRQMRPTSCVIILAGVYATYSKWISIEIELAKEMNKKTIAVLPRGAYRTSFVVKESADVIVGWNTNSIIREIRGF